jgi:hypothetical protein
MKMRSGALAFVLTTILPSIVLACPFCKESIPESDALQRSSLPGGFNMSVYYMLIGLFMTIGLLAGVITKGVRETNARMRVNPPESPGKP